ncbi:UNVERIFIED_CONTAM: hypothetical protein FKN15_042937 [Acipenser sinensis]
MVLSYLVADMGLSPLPPVSSGGATPTPDPQAVGRSTLRPRGESHQSPATEGKPHQFPATEVEQHQSPVIEKDYLLLPPPPPEGDLLGLTSPHKPSCDTWCPRGKQRFHRRRPGTVLRVTKEGFFVCVFFEMEKGMDICLACLKGEEWCCWRGRAHLSRPTPSMSRGGTAGPKKKKGRSGGFPEEGKEEGASSSAHEGGARVLSAHKGGVKGSNALRGNLGIG